MKRSKILMVILTFVLCLSIIPMNVRADVTAVIEYASTSKTTVGGNATYIFEVNAEHKIFDMKLEYDSNVLEYIRGSSIYYEEKVEKDSVTFSKEDDKFLVEGSEYRLLVAEFKVISMPDSGITNIKPSILNMKSIGDSLANIEVVLHKTNNEDLIITNESNNSNINNDETNEDGNRNTGDYNQDGTNNIILYSSIGLNIVTLITILLLFLRKKGNQL